MQENPYEILQVAEYAEPEVIAAAYKRLALKYHPDTNPSLSAKDRMQKINWAYDLLKDPKKRADYDLNSRSRNSKTQTEAEYVYREREREKAREQEREQERQKEKQREQEREMERQREREREQELEREKRKKQELEQELQRERQKQKDWEDPKTSAQSFQYGDAIHKVDPVVVNNKKHIIRKSSIFKTISVSILLLFGYYVFTIIAVLIGYSTYWLNKGVNITIVAIGGILSIIISRFATIGWNPNKKSIFRTLLLFVLMIFPAFSWIPCYLASKTLTKGDLIPNKDRPLRIWIIIYGVLSTALGILMFGNVLPNITTMNQPVNYLSFSNPDIGISFKYPDLLNMDFQVNKERTDYGTIFTVSTISGQSLNPVISLAIQITEDPLRNDMFPELYPPDSTSLKLLALPEMIKTPLIKDKISDEEFDKSYQNIVITKYAGYPAAEYKFTPTNTAIGDAILYGVIIISDKRDVSIKLIASIEPDTEGSVTEEYVSELWVEILKSLHIDY